MLRVVHRHSVLTLPKELQDRVNEVIKYWYNKKKGSNYEVGVIEVIHTFGGDLKWNPHVHDLVTEGAVDKKQSGGSKLSIFHI